MRLHLARESFFLFQPGSTFGTSFEQVWCGVLNGAQILHQRSRLPVSLAERLLVDLNARLQEDFGDPNTVCGPRPSRLDVHTTAEMQPVSSFLISKSDQAGIHAEGRLDLSPLKMPPEREHFCL